jgi:hypothetical protein
MAKRARPNKLPTISMNRLMKEEADGCGSSSGEEGE